MAYEIYDQNYEQAWTLLSPPNKRYPKWLAWGKALLTPLQWLHDLFFTDYAKGSIAPFYDNTLAYSKGDRVIYINNSVYECTADTAPGTIPLDADFWMLIQQNYIGIRERATYSCQALLFEFALNKWFRTEFRQPTIQLAPPDYYLPKSDIYLITNSVNVNTFVSGLTGPVSSSSPIIAGVVDDYIGLASSLNYNTDNFTIMVPAAVFAALGTATEAENKIRSFADTINAAGIIYNIDTY